MGKILRGIRKHILDPHRLVILLNELGFFRFLPEKTCMKLLWRARTGRKLDLEHPRGFNEKLQWMKTYDHNPLYTMLVDKVRVREYVKERIGEQYLVPLLGVWDKPEDIDFDRLPSQFVLKCNHNAGEGMCVCTDKAALDIPKVRQRFRRALSRNFYYSCREWPYKNVVPKILGEEFIVDRDPANTTGTLIDYKFYCFDGEPRFLYIGMDDISAGTKGESLLSFYQLDFTPAPFYRSDHRPMPIEVRPPEGLDEMLRISRELSRGLPFVRVDLYWVNQRILFSELTVFPGAGYGIFSPEEWELKLGEWITLPKPTVQPDSV